MGSTRRAVGVEEELLLFTPSGQPAHAGERLAHATDTGAEHELKLEQTEIASDPSADLDEVTADLLARRRELAAAATRRGVRVAGLATSPVASAPIATPDERYVRMQQRFAAVVVDQLTCGTHVHVDVTSRAEGVVVLDRIRSWLPLLLAVSANSPYWAGTDTGYASYRSIAWGRWPGAGPSSPFGDEAGYDARVDALVASGAALDVGMIYFDARLSARYPTVEIRVADVGQRAADSVLVAGLARALVETAAAGADEPAPDVPVELIRAASWGAARYGLGGELFDPIEQRSRPAADQLDRLLDHVGTALARYGDTDRVRGALDALLADGTGARLQRAAREAGGSAGSARSVVEAAEDRLLR